MGILWLIKKIILIILLAILVLVFAVVGIVLVAPIRYEAYLAKYETLAYDIKFTYLLGIKGNFFLEGQDKNHKVSAFGKILYKDQVVEEASPAEDKQEKVESNIKESKNNRIYTVKEYEETIAANIKEDIDALAEELHLVGSSPAERNIAISRILQRELLSNPN